MNGTWAWWHDFWEIIGALGSAAAAIAAVWIATRERADRKSAEEDRDEARKAQLEAERAESRRVVEAQARRVVVWVEDDFRVPYEDPHTGQTSGGVGIGLRVRNYSDMPVFDAHLVHILNPDPLSESVRVLKPDEEFYARALDGEHERSERGRLGVAFKDAARLNWIRWADGTLNRAQSDSQGPWETSTTA